MLDWYNFWVNQMKEIVINSWPTEYPILNQMIDFEEYLIRYC
jgi:hypothetical protein